ncbi:hypothetical protein [Sorangium sp. So ce394]|uniref:hypothetical protein n=1 Tax=Sorangium sp. So ce394 TaxID=3133310 RepID=UPI003F5B82C0
MASLRRTAGRWASALLLATWGCGGTTILEHDGSAAAGPDDPSSSGTQAGSGGHGGGPNASSGACSAGEARCNASFRRETCTEDGAWIETDFVCARTVAVDDDIGSYCVTKANGAYRCWGSSESSDAVAAPPLPDEIYRRVQLTRHGLIGLTEDGRLRAAEFTIPESPSRVVSFRQTNMGGDVGVCSLQSDGAFEMFLYNPREPDGPSTRTRSVEGGPFSRVYCAWEGMYAAVRADGTVLSVVATPPPGNDFAELAMSLGIFCGLRTDGTISCHRPPADNVGNLDVGPDLPAFPPGRYRSIAATVGVVCAIDEQDALVCKRYDGRDMPVPPARYVFAEGGYNVLCAVRADGSTACFRHGGAGNLDLENVSDFAPVEPPLDPGW